VKGIGNKNGFGTKMTFLEASIGEHQLGEDEEEERIM
jgi:hypothetical protein